MEDCITSDALKIVPIKLLSNFIQSMHHSFEEHFTSEKNYLQVVKIYFRSKRFAPRGSLQLDVST